MIDYVNHRSNSGIDPAPLLWGGNVWAHPSGLSISVALFHLHLRTERDEGAFSGAVIPAVVHGFRHTVCGLARTFGRGTCTVRLFARCMTDARMGVTAGNTGFVNLKKET